MLRKLIYAIKRILHHNPQLYGLLYSVVTFNFDYLKQRIRRHRYVSRFGGMWTDRSDYQHIIQKKLQRGELTSEDEQLLEQWHTKGMVVIQSAIESQTIDAYLNEVESLKHNKSSSPLLITASTLPEPTPYSEAQSIQNSSVRVVDDYFYSLCSRNLLLNPVITNFLESIFETKPVLTQSLAFTMGSEQAIHQDTAFVRMNSPMKLAAVWIALEDVIQGSGELIYYPGSHRWSDYLFSGRFKHYDEERDGPKQLSNWYQWIHDEAKRQNTILETFLPKKGDILFWHAALAHGGAPIENPNATRKSLVGHYCSEGSRPLYHYYKPGQRKLYKHNQFEFTTSYYRKE